MWPKNIPCPECGTVPINSLAVKYPVAYKLECSSTDCEWTESENYENLAAPGDGQNEEVK